MTDTIDNPFDDWTEDKQCFGNYAEDTNGCIIHYTSPEACKWCAGGYIAFKGIPVYIRMRFSVFLTNKYGASTVELNDAIKWKPERFKKVWDEFIVNLFNDDFNIIEDKLNNLKVGLEVWVKFKSKNEKVDSDSNSLELGFLRVERAWGIYIREKVEGHKPTVWHFKSAPRSIRISAIDSLQDLIDSIYKKASKTLKKLEEKTLEVRSIGENLK